MATEETRPSLDEYRLRALERAVRGDHGLESRVTQILRKLDVLTARAENQDEDIRETRTELKGTKRAMWSLVSAITVASIVFAAGIIQLVIVR